MMNQPLVHLVGFLGSRPCQKIGTRTEIISRGPEAKGSEFCSWGTLQKTKLTAPDRDPNCDICWRTSKRCSPLTPLDNGLISRPSEPHWIESNCHSLPFTDDITIISLTS